MVRKRARLKPLPRVFDARAHPFWEERFERMLRDYSALNAPTSRARAIANYPWADVDGQGPAWNARWAELRGFVVRVMHGDVPDPCPNAVHWGGTMDIPHGRMVPARCSARTANTFYALRRT